jgi:Flp pilus assembly protein protease CpaA
MNFCLLLADLVAVVHAAYTVFVVIGFALIIAGLVMRREWSRAFWFRAAHPVAIAFGNRRKVRRHGGCIALSKFYILGFPTWCQVVHLTVLAGHAADRWDPRSAFWM